MKSPAAATAEPQQQQQQQQPSVIDQEVDRWFVEVFHNRGIDTPEFNRLSAARDALKARLAAATKE